MLAQTMAPNSTAAFIDSVLETMDDTSSNDTEEKKPAADNSKSKRRQASLLTSSSPGKLKKPYKSQQQSVRFDVYDSIAEVPHIDDFSKRKINRIWYTGDEQRANREICIGLVNRFDAGEDMSHEEMLGLEKRTREALKGVKAARRAGTYVVFGLQGIENEQDGVLLSEQIAELYKKTAAESELDAHEWAFQFAAEVALQ
jgi:hypothetical protein